MIMERSGQKKVRKADDISSSLPSLTKSQKVQNCLHSHHDTDTAGMTLTQQAQQHFFITDTAYGDALKCCTPTHLYDFLCDCTTNKSVEVLVVAQKKPGICSNSRSNAWRHTISNAVCLKYDHMLGFHHTHIEVLEDGGA